MGVPTLGCDCAVCQSPDPRDNRTRPSIALRYNGHTVLIDTGPDFRHQMLRELLDRVDAVLYTHSHADHILGLDDLRPLSFLLPAPLPLYADDKTQSVLRRIFDYTFSRESKYPTSARVDLLPLADRIELFGAWFQRLDVHHGSTVINGFRFGSAAYLTDMSNIPAHTLDRLHGLDILILDALRPQPHPTHANIATALRFVAQLQPKRAYFTHMSHEISHGEVDRALPEGVHLAYDGLRLEFDIA